MLWLGASSRLVFFPLKAHKGRSVILTPQQKNGVLQGTLLDCYLHKHTLSQYLTSTLERCRACYSDYCSKAHSESLTFTSALEWCRGSCLDPCSKAHSESLTFTRTLEWCRACCFNWFAIPAAFPSTASSKAVLPYLSRQVNKRV